MQGVQKKDKFHIDCRVYVTAGKEYKSMLKLGKTQILTVVKEVNFGVYLAEADDSEHRVLLPAKQVPEGTKIGDEIKVFLYKDSSDRLISTTNTPKLQLDGFAVLKVLEVTGIGAFLDWGLEKDLFLPFKEQLRKLEKGDEILVRLYIDKSSRLCATMKGLYDVLFRQPPYRQDDVVTARVYEFSKNFGTFLAVDDKYSARIPIHEDCRFLKIGDVIEAKVVGVKEDGKLDLTLRDKAYVQMDTDAEKIMQLMERHGGALSVHDKSSPEVIMQETGLSKNAFKRAVGRLYKERKIIITETGIKKV